MKLSPGDVLLVHSSGGGGWGDPAQRSAAQHAADRLSGLVTDRGPRMSFIIGIDVGGTFTDLVAVDARGQTTSAKASTTPADPGVGLFEGLDELARRLGVTRRALLRDAQRVIHGTTVATNALLERKGAKVGLLTTEGHRDILEMREGLKDDRYNLRMPPPVPLVPRHLRLGVRERMDAQGAVRVPLDPASLAAAIARLREADVEAVAICFLHGYRNPATRRLRPMRSAPLCPASSCPRRTRSIRRSRNSSGPRRRSSMPMSVRSSRPICRASKRA